MSKSCGSGVILLNQSLTQAITHLQTEKHHRLGLATEDISHTLTYRLHQHREHGLGNIGTGMLDVQLTNGLAQPLGILLGDQQWHLEDLAGCQLECESIRTRPLSCHFSLSHQFSSVFDERT